MHLPLLALAPVPPGKHPLASASCAVRMISTATTVTNPCAAIIAKITNVEFVSMGSKYFTKYRIMIRWKFPVYWIPLFLAPFLEILHNSQVALQGLRRTILDLKKAALLTSLPNQQRME